MREDRRRVKKKRKLVKALVRMIPFFIAIILIAIISAVSLKNGILEKYSYSQNKADLNEYFGLTSTDQIPLMMDNKYSIGGICKANEKYYLDSDIVSEKLDDNYYYNEGDNCLLYTTGTETLEYKEGDDYIIGKDSKLYLSTDMLSEYAAFELITYSDPERVELIYNWDNEISETEIKKNTQCRVLGGIKSDVLTDVIKGSKVQVLSSMDEWSEVKTEDGFIGYIQNKMFSDILTRKPTPAVAKNEIVVNHNLYDGKICLGWHQVMSMDANQTFDSVVSNTKGMNVISPTWFSVTSNNGDITSIGSSDYVNKAHEKGMRVWALVDNFDKGVSTYEVLSHRTSRTNLESQLVAATLGVGADGINIDFENLDVECGPHFAQFIRELSLLSRNAGLVLSVDNYVPKEYTSFYRRDVQGRFADYVVIMGYDEHFSGSAEAGSVASFDYVKEGIEKTIDEVDKSQVINGIPFYTRIWHEGATLDSEAVGMGEAIEYVKNRGAEIVWDDVTAQNYAEFTDSDGRNCKVWLEDEESINAKLNLVDSNDIAGVAFWKLGLEKPEIWNVIEGYMVK